MAHSMSEVRTLLSLLSGAGLSFKGSMLSALRSEASPILVMINDGHGRL